MNVLQITFVIFYSSKRIIYHNACVLQQHMYLLKNVGQSQKVIAKFETQPFPNTEHQIFKLISIAFTVYLQLEFSKLLA